MDTLELPVHNARKPTCEGCVAHCCRYITIEIDRPRAKWQYDQIRWMLLHENISVGVDHDGDWFVEVQTRCGELDSNNLCRSYLERPQLCEEYSNEECQVWNPEPPFKLEFKTAREFVVWLDRRKIDWRYKSHERRRAPAGMLRKKAARSARKGRGGR